MLTVKQRFDKFDTEYPDVYIIFKNMATEALSCGATVIRPDKVIHRVEWAMMTHSREPSPEIDLAFGNQYARKLAEEDPRFQDFFDFRTVHQPSLDG